MDTIALDHLVRRFLDSLIAARRPSLHEQSIAAARRGMVESQRAASPSLPAADIAEVRILRPPDPDLLLRIVKPPDAAAPLAPVVFLHGGGWLSGDRDTHDLLVRRLAIAAGAAVVVVEYSRTPEAQFPTALEETYAATEYVVTQAESLGVDADRLIVAGDSAGGNLAAAVCLLAKHRRGPAIAAQVLLYPTTDGLAETESRRLFGSGFFLSSADIDYTWQLYVPAALERHTPLASPVRAPLSDLIGLPPALVITAEFDPLRDEGEAYAHRLIQAGVSVTAVRYLSTIHAFATLNDLADSAAARSAIRTIAEFIHRTAPVAPAVAVAH